MLTSTLTRSLRIRAAASNSNTTLPILYTATTKAKATPRFCSNNIRTMASSKPNSGPPAHEMVCTFNLPSYSRRMSDVNHTAFLFQVPLTLSIGLFPKYALLPPRILRRIPQSPLDRSLLASRAHDYTRGRRHWR